MPLLELILLLLSVKAYLVMLYPPAWRWICSCFRDVELAFWGFSVVPCMYPENTRSCGMPPHARLDATRPACGGCSHAGLFLCISRNICFVLKEWLILVATGGLLA